MSWKCSWYFGLCSFILRSPWSISSRIFHQTSLGLYTKISLPVMLLVSVLSGFYFAALAFTHIWIISPTRKVLLLYGIQFRKLIQVFLGEILASLALVWRFVFAGQQLSLATGNTQLSGVFLAKHHWQHDQHFRRGGQRDKSKRKYQNLKRPLIPFSGRKFTKKIETKLQFMRLALEMAQIKLPSLEVLESAFRLAVVKREQRLQAGAETFSKSLQLARSRRNERTESGGQEEGEDHAIIEDIKNDIKIKGSSLWILAKQLALARLKRGKTNWMKAKRRLMIPEKKKSISFWFRAKNVVFSSRSEGKNEERKTAKKFQ